MEPREALHRCFETSRVMQNIRTTMTGALPSHCTKGPSSQMEPKSLQKSLYHMPANHEANVLNPKSNARSPELHIAPSTVSETRPINNPDNVIAFIKVPERS